ncbi:MAG: cadherin repeat domain-containing protein, partial [Candidatus Delongbacteria bacterium]|nr:cadherin repeat domain-containing protein [Candidatus Delongbacteria bacterium]
MRKQLAMIIILAFMMLSFGQTIWDGGKITFTKADFADAILAENQDRITDSTWVTRNDQEGLFNAYYESFYNGSGPTNTEWAYGTTANYLTLNYLNWENWQGGGMGKGPLETLGRDAVVHLISEDIYIDIKFTAWTSMGSGGGFTYERSLDPNSGPMGINLSNDVIYDGYPSGTIVGLLSTADGDVTANYEYSFVDGENHNSDFSIVGDELQTNFIANMESQSTYELDIMTMNTADSLFVEKHFFINIIPEPTVWEGVKYTFTKGNYADYTIMENQDRLTDRTWITRGDDQGIFNPFSEEGYSDSAPHKSMSSPENTEWANGN